MRDCILRAVSLVGVFLSIAVSSAAAQGSPPDIQLGLRPAQAGTQIEVAFPSDATRTSTTIPVFIGQGGDTVIEDVTLYGELEDCSGQPLTQGAVQFLQPEADEPLGAITLPAGSGRQRARIRIADLGNQYGVFCGFLAAEVDGQHYIYNSLSVQRPAPPQVVIREASDDKRITLSTSGPTLKEALFISETGGETGVQDLRMTISPLRAPGNETAVLDQPAPIDLAPGSSALVDLTGEIPSLATYRGVLRLETDASASEYDLVIDRQAMTATVRMEAVAPLQRMVIPMSSRTISLLSTAVSRSAFVQQWAPGLDDLLISVSSTNIPITLVETSGGTAEVYYPTLARLTAVDDEDNVTTAPHGDPSLFECDGGAAPVTNDAGQPNLLTLNSYQTACLRLAIPGLDQAGKMVARLELRSPTGGNSSADVTIRLKDHWILAALVIFLGGLLSYSLRSWLTIGRPTQIKSLKVVRYEQLVSETIPEAGDPIRLALLRKLTSLRSQMQVDSSLDVDAELANVGTHLDDYSVVHAVIKIDVIQTVPPEHQGAARTEIEAIEALLGQADPLAQLPAAKTRAAALRKQIDQWNQTALQQGITELRAAMEVDGERLEKLGLDQDKLEQYLTSLTKLKADLPAVAGIQEAINNDYKGVRQRYEQAAGGYARLAPTRLRLIIEGQKLPSGFDQEDWENLRDELLAELQTMESQSISLAELQETVDKLRKRYLEKITAKLSRAAADFKSQYETKPGMEDAVKGMDDAIRTLANAEAALDNNLDEAEQLYLTAGEQYKKALPPDQLGQIQGAGGQALSGAPASALGSMAPMAHPGTPAPEAKKVTKPATVDAIVADIKRRDQRVLLIVSLVSVVVGISLLWVPDKTFGGLADYIAVFLWGFGLHQLNAVALPDAVRGQELPWYPAQSQGQQQVPGQQTPDLVA